MGQTLLRHHKNDAKYRVATLNSPQGRDLKQLVVGGTLSVPTVIRLARAQACSGMPADRSRQVYVDDHRYTACTVSPIPPPRAPFPNFVNILFTMKQMGLGPRRNRPNMKYDRPRSGPSLVESPHRWLQTTDQCEDIIGLRAESARSWGL